MKQLQQLDITLNMYESSVSEHIALQGSHPAAGPVLETHLEYAEIVVFRRLTQKHTPTKSLHNEKAVFQAALLA